MAFPEGFLWGAATSSFQVEGAVREEGRGECIWMRFARTPGNIHNNDTGEVACDHYHRYRDDVKLMQDIGLQAYRFSISWPRIIPQGTGITNPFGLGFYDHLVDALLEAGIVPFATLYHWDFPQALQNRGGWPNPDSVRWFTEYAHLMSRRLGDRVKHWITFNEPWVIGFLGHWWGVHAPGIKDLNAAYRAIHHLLLAHGASVPAIRANVRDAQVGITLDLHPTYPATPGEADQQAAYWCDAVNNRWFLDPVLKGSYPAEVVEFRRDTLAGIDLNAIDRAAAPIDFLGVNYYTRFVLASDSGAIPYRHVRPEPATFTDMDWEVFPEGLTALLLYLKDDYAPPAIYITENGAAFADREPADGQVADPERIDYLKTHFAAAEAAIAQGVPLKGYFVWSLMDNFEWGNGYSKRFGLIYIDYPTQQRIFKSSAHWYRRVIAANAVVE